MNFLMKFTLGVALSIAPGLAIAKAENLAEKFDKDDDKYLAGNEIARYRAELQSNQTGDNIRRRARLREMEATYAARGFIPVAELAVDVKTVSCKFDQRVFIRATVIDLPLTDCAEIRPKSDGAKFSVKEDRKANITTVKIAGGLGLVLVPARTFDFGRPDNPKAFHLVDLAISAFGEADGTFQTAKVDKGYLRAGGKVDWLFNGGGLDRLALSTAGYYQSDLGFGSSGYGFQITATPQKFDWFLNAFTRGEDDKHDFVIEAWAALDTYRVTDPGATALRRADYAWLGGKLGFEFVDRTLWKKGIVLGSNVEAFWDAVGGEDAFLWTTKLDMILDPDERVTVGLEYKRGNARQNPAFQDVASLNFGLKF